MNMPNISVYLNQETFKLIKNKSKLEKLPISSIVRDAIEQYLKTSENKRARHHLLNQLTKKKPLGDWESLHRERTSEDAYRS